MSKQDLYNPETKRVMTVKEWNHYRRQDTEVWYHPELAVLRAKTPGEAWADLFSEIGSSGIAISEDLSTAVVTLAGASAELLAASAASPLPEEGIRLVTREGRRVRIYPGLVTLEGVERRAVSYWGILADLEDQPEAGNHPYRPIDRYPYEVDCWDSWRSSGLGFFNFRGQQFQHAGSNIDTPHFVSEEDILLDPENYESY